MTRKLSGQENVKIKLSLEAIVPRWSVTLNPKSTRKTINRALFLHNYSFRNLEKYKSLRSKGGATRELQGEALYPRHKEMPLPPQGIRVTFMYNFYSFVLIMPFTS
jgi:hypothetical protein